MRIFAIADLHLSFATSKPMDIFGPHWERHTSKIESAWRESVAPQDVVLIVGDISWAMKLASALPDLAWIDALPGKKILVRGNHDYWWSSAKSAAKMKSLMPPSLYPIHKSAEAVEMGGRRVGIAGTRGWAVPPATENDAKILRNEESRLRTSLEALPPVDRKIAMIHIPPFGPDLWDTSLTRILKEHSVDMVVYGHIHRGFGEFFEGERDGIVYHNVAVDQIDFRPKALDLSD